MDKKSIDSLNNLSDSIEQLAQAIIGSKQKGGKGENPLASVDILTQLKEINQSLTEIKSDNKKMLSKQDEILKLSKEIKDAKEKNNIFGQVNDDKNKSKIKDGISTIMLIAVGVLAIGMAFKIIGKVDFFSVIALAIAIPLIAMAFADVVKTKMQPKDAAMAGLSMVILSGAILASSMLLYYVQPISFMQLVTTIGIAFAFNLVGKSIKEISESVAKANIKGLLMMPLVFGATALAIVGASYLLTKVQVVGFFQLVTTIGIAAAFAVIGRSIGGIAESVAKAPLKGLLIMPLALIAVSAAIVGASYLLQNVQPVGFAQLISAIGIAAVFVVLSFGINRLVKAMDKIEPSDVITLPLILVTISGAIMLSSHILKETAIIPIGNLFSIVMYSIAFTIATIAVSAAIWVLDKLGLNLAKAVVGGLSVVVIAGTIALSSQILSMGDYSNFPDIMWALGVGLSIGAFGLAMVGLGTVIMSGVGALALLAGAVGVLGVAATIVGVAAILGEGDYSKFPSLEWSASVALSMGAFAMGMMVVGGIIVASFGLGALALEAGRNAMLTVAQSIVDVGDIIAGGNFSGGPTKSWAEGISLALGAFSPVYGYIMQSQVMSIFGGDAMTGDEYGAVMVSIAQSIITVADVFNRAGISAWSNAPTKEWAEGVGLAIGAFAPVFAHLEEGFGDQLLGAIFGKTDKTKQMSDAMIAIAHSIIAVAGIFNTSTQQYKGGPTKEWGEGVGSAISGFAQAYAALEDADLEDAEDIKEYNGALFEIVNSIIAVATRVKGAGDVFSAKLSKSFFEGIAENIRAYVDLVDDIGDTLSGGSIFGKGIKIVNIVSDIILVAKAYALLAKSISAVGTNMTKLGDDQIQSLKYLTANIALLTLGDPAQLEENIDILADKSESLAETFKTMTDELAKQNELNTTGGKNVKPNTVKPATGPKVTKTNDDLYAILQQIGSKLDGIASSASNLASYADELRGKPKSSFSKK